MIAIIGALCALMGLALGFLFAKVNLSKQVEAAKADALMATVRKAIHALELYKKAGQKLIALRCKLLKPDFLSSYIMDAIRLDPILFVDSEIKSVAAFARSLMI